MTQNLLINEAEEQVLKFCRVVRPVDNVAIVLQIELGLSTENKSLNFYGVRLGWLGKLGYTLK